ncbi:MAG: TIGR03620 family F420-dependent LLM class oxidoreductase [Chloroflexota bacterium]|nr:TIGR03620 family F420-dependent LLM class oxidoreductase [Chloroflexota bacterium]
MPDHDVARSVAQRIGRVGAWSFALERLTAARAQDFTREVESLGYTALWIPESLGSKEIFGHAAVLLAAGGGITVASGIASIWARDAVAMANGARTLLDAYPDRFLLGLGASHAPVVERRGARYVRPLSRMREYLDAMDQAPYVGPNRGDPRPPRVLAALGPKMLQLSATRAEGAHPYFVPLEHTPFARKQLGDGPLLAVEQAAVLSTDAAVARKAARAHMKRYLELDNYANNLRRLGWGDDDIGGGGSDAMVDAIVAWGEPERVAERVRAHLETGADHVCLQMLGTDTAEELRRLAPLLA